MRISDWSSDVCSSDLLRPRARYLRAQPLHLPRADHTDLVDDKNIARSQRIGTPRPAIFETGERPRRDARTALQILGPDPRSRRAQHAISAELPRFARSPPHRPLAGASLAGDQGQPRQSQTKEGRREGKEG